MDKFYNIQVLTFKYMDKLSDATYFELVDAFVFNNEDNDEVKKFLIYMECYDDYLLHLGDIKNPPYFLKCSGSRLEYLELVKRSLLVYSYNRLKERC